MHLRAQASLPFIPGLAAHDSSITYPVKSAAMAHAPSKSRNAIPLFTGGLLDRSILVDLQTHEAVDILPGLLAAQRLPAMAGSYAADWTSISLATVVGCGIGPPNSLSVFRWPSIASRILRSISSRVPP